MTKTTDTIDALHGKAIPPWVKRAIVWFWVTALAAFYFVGVLRALHDLLIVLFMSLFMSFAIEPAVNFLERRGIRRGYGTVIVLLVAFASAVAMTAAVGKALVDQTEGLVDQAPVYIEDIEEWISDTFNTEISFNTLRDEFLEGGGMQNLFQRFSGDILNAGTTAVRVLVHLLAGALFTFYLVADGPKFRHLVLSSLSEEYRATILKIWDLAIAKTGGYIYSRAALALMSAVFHWIAFALLDVPSPLALGLWVGVVSQFIPAVGTYIAGGLPVCIAVLDNPKNGLFALIAVVAYQQVENYFFAPRVTAHTMKMHVALAFGAVLTGITLLGIVGAFLALPCAATIQAWLSGWGAARREKYEKELKAEQELLAAEQELLTEEGLLTAEEAAEQEGKG